ncbi:cobaltochelatase CobT-related protein [Galbibacter sp. BG1]
MNREIVELREVVTKLIPMLVGKGLRVTQRGSEAYVVANPVTRKPEQVNIPNIPDTAEPSFVRAIQGFIDHEVGHVLITDWDWVAGYRVTPQQLMNKKVQRLRSLHNIIEDTMIEREMERIFPGSKRNIGDLRRHFIAKITKPAVAAAKDDKEKFNYLLVVTMRALAGHTEFQDYMDDENHWNNPLVKELVGKLSASVKKSLLKARTTRETLEIAKVLDGILYPVIPPPTIAAVTPNQGFTVGGDAVKITGTNFQDIEWVKFDGSLAKILAHQDTRNVVIETPAHSAGLVTVEIQTEHGSASKVDAFEYVTPPPSPSSSSNSSQENSEDGEAQDQKSSDQSQDKPDKKASKGDGTGERDHQPSAEDEKSEDVGNGEAEVGDNSEGETDAPQDKEGSEETDCREDDQTGSGDKEVEDDQSEEPGDGEDDADDEQSEENGANPADESSDEDGEKDDEKTPEDAEGGDPQDASDSSDDSGDEDPDEDDELSSNDEDEEDSDDGNDPEEGESSNGEKGQKTDRLAIQTDDHDAGDLGVAEESDDDSGGGVGGGLGKSLFDFADDAFDKADVSSQLAVLIANEAVDLLRDNDYNVFTREFDRIEILQPPTINPAWVPELDEKTRSMTGRMQKDIERMMASQSHVIRVPGFRAGRLNGPSLHRIVQGDDRLFNRKQEHKSKETAVTLLVDNSGSMSGAKIETAMVAAYALAQTLERVGIPCELMGFTTGDHRGAGSRKAVEETNRQIWKETQNGVTYHRTVPIVMPIYKEFDERINSEVKKRIAYMANAQNGMVTNVDGESLEYAAIRLMRRREKRKVMLVLSDGQPAGARNAAGHLKQTTEKLEKIGIDLVGIGIMDQAVRRFYKNHIVLNRVEDLPTEVMRELKAILTN